MVDMEDLNPTGCFGVSSDGSLSGPHSAARGSVIKVYIYIYTYIYMY